MHSTSRPAAPRFETFPQVLQHRLSRDGTRPLLTAYDEATGERTELSVTTYANWVSKTANLLTDELALDPGDTVRLALPAHWLVPVFLGAAWSAGLTITTDPAAPYDLLVRGPEHDGPAGDSAPVLACALLPFAVRFPNSLPAEIMDYGLMWPGQSDDFLPLEKPSAGTPAWSTAERTTSQTELLEAAVQAFPGPERLLTDVHPAAGRGVTAFLGPLVSGGSVVLLRNASPAHWSAHFRDERATAELRSAN